MVKRGSGVVVKIVFENLTSTYVILDLDTRQYYRYYGQDYRKLEFRLSDYVTFNKLPGIPYVVQVKNYTLKVEDNSNNLSKNENFDLNTNETVNVENDKDSNCGPANK